MLGEFASIVDAFSVDIKVKVGALGEGGVSI